VRKKRYTFMTMLTMVCLIVTMTMAGTAGAFAAETEADALDRLEEALAAAKGESTGASTETGTETAAPEANLHTTAQIFPSTDFLPTQILGNQLSGTSLIISKTRQIFNFSRYYEKAHCKLVDK